MTVDRTPNDTRFNETWGIRRLDAERQVPPYCPMRFFPRRFQLFEFNEQGWLPPLFRSAITDAITFIAGIFNLYAPAIPLLERTLDRIGEHRIIDLCSGSGGPVEVLRERLRDANGKEIRLTLTDEYPNVPAWEQIARRSDGKVAFSTEPVDAAAVPSHLQGFRTLFTAFHHFPPDKAKAILLNAVQGGRGIGIFEYTNRNLLRWLYPTLFTAATIFVITPFLRPFTLGRLFWTYVIPVIPLAVTWDCLVSGLRTYLPHELLEMTRDPGCVDYEWEAERINHGALTYLIGYPKSDGEPRG